MKIRFINCSLFCAVLCLCAGCVSTRENVLGREQSAVRLRSMQGMTLETQDLNLVLRSTISTLQDFGFILEQADEVLGMVSGTAFPSGAKISVIARLRGERVYVRANIQHNMHPVEDPAVYQRFYNALAQSMFLTANLEEVQPPDAAQNVGELFGGTPTAAAPTVHASAQPTQTAAPNQPAKTAHPQFQRTNGRPQTRTQTQTMTTQPVQTTRKAKRTF